MKKLLFTVALATAALAANAQTDKGRLFLNGGVSMYSRSVERDDDEKVSEVSFSPAVGYFLTDRFALGLGLSLSSNRSQDIDDNVEVERSSSGLFITPFARYYVPTAGDKFHFFAQATVGVGSGNSKIRTGSVTMEGGKYQAVDFALSPGFAYFPSDHWAAELRFRGFYINSINPDGNDNNSTIVGLDVNSLTPSLGLSYFF